MAFRTQVKRLAIAALVAGGMLEGALLKGVALDNQTGRPLARARVSLEPVGRTSAQTPPAMFADSSGQFVFVGLPAGAYLVKAEKRGYLTARFGQRKWDLPGTPVVLDSEGHFMAEIRMQRLGAISGEVVDENRLGLPGQGVYAWRLGRQIRLAAGAETDDRGVFRIAGLGPGRYYIRTTQREMEDRQGLLPTYFGQVLRAQEARVVELAPEQEVGGVHITPFHGRLSTLAVTLAGDVPARVILMTDTGRRDQSTQPGGTVEFDQLAPGEYEVVAEGGGGAELKVAQSTIVVGKERELVTLQLQPAPRLLARCVDQQGRARNPPSMSIFVRRREGVEEAERKRVRCGETLSLTPGEWEFAAVAPPDQYVAAVRGAVPGGTSYIVKMLGQGVQEVTVVIERQPSKLAGKVTMVDGTGAVGAPVFLYAIDMDLRSRLGGVRMVRSNQNGGYEFVGLAPGHYEVISSYALQDPGEAEWPPGRGAAVNVEAGREKTLDVEVVEEVR